jgi:hypothetical protein
MSFTCKKTTEQDHWFTKAHDYFHHMQRLTTDNR